MAKYKVGDRVRVRDDLNCDDAYGGFGVAKAMLKFRGQWVTIKQVDYGDDTYRITGDDCWWWWSEAMFSEDYSMKYDALSVAHTIQWLSDHYTDGSYTKVFGGEYPLKTLTEMFTSEEIIQRIRENGKEGVNEI